MKQDTTSNAYSPAGDPPTPPICKDCVWFIKKLLDIERCGHRSATYIDPVNGERKHTWCGTMRMNIDGACGPNGQFFAKYTKAK